MNNAKSVLVALSLLGLGAASPAAATQLLEVSGSGVWAANAPTTAYSAPGATYAFKFRVAETYLASYADVGLKETTSFTDYQYRINGAVVAGAPDDIAFFDTALNGGIALAYASHSIEFIGPDVGSSGTITPGQYGAFYPNIDYVLNANAPIDEGAGPTAFSITAVPEPAAWRFMLLGLGAAGGALRARRRGSLSVR